MLLMHGIKSLMIKKQMAAEIGVELSQLAKEITYFEQEERSPLLERGEDQAYRSPVKERMKMIQTKFDGAKTPEQFIKV